jgi:hypothetical protein
MSSSANSTKEICDIPSDAANARRFAVSPDKKYSNAQPLWHLILLYIFTFGLYFYYWSYIKWKHLKEYKNLEINPAKKAILLVIPIVGFIVVWGQFIAIRDFCKEAGAGISFKPSLVITGLVATNIMSWLPDPFWLLSLLFFVPLAFVQRVLNSTWAEIEPGLSMRKLPTLGDILAVVVSWVCIIIIGIIWG